MSLQIAVCIKSVPDPDHYDDISLDPDTKTLVRNGIPTVINEADKHAIELAMQLKESDGARVSIFTMAPPQGKRELLSALGYGADDAFLLSDRRVGGSDTFATSYALSKAITAAGTYDLILTGNESADGATAHVPSQLGEWLHIPHMTDVISLENKEDTAVEVRKEFENGYGCYTIKLPCVIGVKKTMNIVRYPSVKMIFAAKKKPITTFTVDDLSDVEEKYLGLSGSPTKAGSLVTPDYSRETLELTGTTEELAQKVMEIVNDSRKGRV